MYNKIKHQKIFELTRIAPKYSCHRSGDLIPYNGNIQMEWNEAFYKYYSPYYTESQLWEMIPSVDKVYTSLVDNLCVLRCRQLSQIGYQSIDNYGSYDIHSAIEFNNLHEALLDMVLWAIERGKLA